MATVGTIRGVTIRIAPDGRRVIDLDGISYSAEREFAHDTILVVAKSVGADGKAKRQHRTFNRWAVERMDRPGGYDDSMAFCLAETIRIDHNQNLRNMPGQKVYYSHWDDEESYLGEYLPRRRSTLAEPPKPSAAQVQREAEQAELESNPLYGMF